MSISYVEPILTAKFGLWRSQCWVDPSGNRMNPKQQRKPWREYVTGPWQRWRAEHHNKNRSYLQNSRQVDYIMQYVSMC